jgi:serine/threonine protein phosphatase PrpC
MHKITSIALKGCVPYKTQSEDFFFKQGNFFVVTDGVSRSFQGKYPKPSPARVVAETVATVLGLHLIAGLDILTAFQTANKSAYSLNKVFGFLNTDYLFSDLAGCVASAITVHDNTFKYGFIGDCGVAKLDQHANLIWHTPDEVAPVVRTFKTLIYETVVNERLVRIRRDFRNKPQADHLTYGVITGEKEAMSYVRTGEMDFQKGETIALYSDGVFPFLLDPDFRHLLLSGNKKKITEYLKANSSPTKNNDDKTIIIIHN